MKHFLHALEFLAGRVTIPAYLQHLRPVLETQALHLWKRHGFIVPEDLERRAKSMTPEELEELAWAFAYLAGLCKASDYLGLAFVPSGPVLADELREALLEFVKGHGFQLVPEKLPF